MFQNEVPLIQTGKYLQELPNNIDIKLYFLVLKQNY